ncbi:MULTISPECIES: UDP-N-acetyl-D-mannosamine dehydrogenase [unclassified Corynebacterium]|uniref:UDP-N-acetyl-D-mannosamine dehydrogenase n=1 Tax=unclassified Corynebacterium TaxID=2624378 RepID=UPI001E3D495E|nr:MULTISPECIES: UDP-N-acetyl-D-mannosamine dehydrogenase [unclassified Corynebacterium]
MEQSPITQLTVVGLGYIGLPTAVFFANAGLAVQGVDTSSRVLDSLNNGQASFDEPGFSPLLCDALDSGLLQVSGVVEPSEAFVIAVPTPLGKGRSFDDSYIKSAVDAIAPHLRGGELIILESTSTPGTTETVARRVLGQRPDLSLEEGRDNSVYFAYCPERVIPGKITLEMPANDRVVGGTTETATLMAEALYSNFVTGSIRCSNATTAEMVKLTENAFRDVNIAFANELSLISAELSVDVWELIELANHHPRVNILSPGPGVGGHCIAVDPWFLAASASSAPLIHAARAVNDSKPTFVVEEIQKAIDSNESKALSVFGLAFKADVGDLRESPSLEIVRNVAERNPAVSVMVVEPYVTCLPPALKDLANVTLVSVEKALDESTLAVMLVGHKQFLTVDQDLFASAQLLDFTGKWSS